MLVALVRRGAGLPAVLLVLTAALALAAGEKLARRAEQLEERSRYRDAEMLREQVLKAQREILGEEHPDTALAHNQLALCRHHQGQVKPAQEGYERALAIYRKLFG